MPARFSVPARRPRSCPPPRSSGTISIPAARTSAPTPCGPPSLCADRRHEIGAERSRIERNLARRLHRVAMKERALGMGECRGLGHRLDHAGLVVGEHQRDQRRPRIPRSCVRAPRDRRCRRASPGCAMLRVRLPAPNHARRAETSTRRAGKPPSARWIGLGAAAGEDHRRSGAAPTSAATWDARLLRRSRLAARPQRCTEEGLPQCASAAAIAAAASGRSGAVAFQSR